MDPDEKPVEEDQEIERDPRRAFTTVMKRECWQKQANVTGRDPVRWKRDMVENILFYPASNCYGPVCYQYDHTYPWAKGGRTSVENCEALQSSVNNFKSDKEYVPYEELKASSKLLYLS